MTTSPRWFTSSYSSNGGNCIEVATNLVSSRGVVPVRDTKDRAGSVLEFRADVFASFVTCVKAGGFGSV
ncbi:MULTISPECIES: DUF397 domain-containing protein [Streptomyces]|uniref:DUF397 domain-containing protein n=1 Tax=Streptomyces TaxID=1883 RepID=UPI00073DB868|nr:DUF397 domain-containing protein [Streptomyces sp. EAS-AB2608]MYU29586.1 DUF397 domain-containing protein [Streptomyces sp. SID7810]BCM69013.1 hypothetical protein EASAB2608_04347 [Streptomyces sp. EAS-AB2608]CUW30645.1 hypothetical protein TUE45_05379 [Streptomyces reticuli]